MPKRPGHGPCSVIGCGKPLQIRQWCGNHYRRFRLTGRSDAVRARDKRSHPLYTIWWERKQRGSLCEAWAADLWAFAEAVGAQPSPTHLLRPLCYGEPYGPGNFEWLAALKRGPGETCKAFTARKWQSRRERHPNAEPHRHIGRKYGITPERFQEMLTAQGGVCAICGEPETRLHPKTHAPQALAVDHCHARNNVRGLLCWRCNTVLGKVNDAPGLLLAMIAYLNAGVGDVL